MILFNLPVLWKYSENKAEVGIEKDRGYYDRAGPSEMPSSVEIMYISDYYKEVHWSNNGIEADILWYL